MFNCTHHHWLCHVDFLLVSIPYVLQGFAFLHFRWELQPDIHTLAQSHSSLSPRFSHLSPTVVLSTLQPHLVLFFLSLQLSYFDNCTTFVLMSCYYFFSHCHGLSLIWSHGTAPFVLLSQYPPTLVCSSSFCLTLITIIFMVIFIFDFIFILSCHIYPCCHPMWFLSSPSLPWWIFVIAVFIVVVTLISTLSYHCHHRLYD